MTQDRLELDEPSKVVLRESRGLLRSKERRAQGRFLVEGRQAVREALAARRFSTAPLRALGQRRSLDLIGAARESNVPVFGVSEQNLATMSDTVSQGVIAVADAVDVTLALALGAAPRLVVVCDQIRDPGSAGTVIRCADAFGADAVLMSTDSVDIHNPKVVRASVGSIFHLPIVVGVDLAAGLDACRGAGLQVWATDGEAEATLLDPGGGTRPPHRLGDGERGVGAAPRASATR